MVKTCPICGKTFESNYYRQKYCSEDCYRQGNRNRSAERVRKNSSKRVEPPNTRPAFVKGACLHCGKKFSATFPNEKFCSDKCRLNYFSLDDTLTRIFVKILKAKFGRSA